MAGADRAFAVPVCVVRDTDTSAQMRLDSNLKRTKSSKRTRRHDNVRPLAPPIIVVQILLHPLRLRPRLLMHVSPELHPARLARLPLPCQDEEVRAFDAAADVGGLSLGDGGGGG